MFDARSPEPEPTPDADREIEAGLFELIEAYRQALKSAAPFGIALEIETEPVTVRDRILAVMGALELRETIEFEQVLSASLGGGPTREMIVTTFLAILELAPLDALRIYQGVSPCCGPQLPIRLRRAGELGDDSWRDRVSDIT